MHGGAWDDADRRKPGQDGGGLEDSRGVVGAWPGVDSDDLGATGAGTHEVIGRPAPTGQLEVVRAPKKLQPRPVRVADEVGKAPQLPCGEAPLRGAKQAMACVTVFLFPALPINQVNELFGQPIRFRADGNHVGEEAELAGTMPDHGVSTPQERNRDDRPHALFGRMHERG